MIYNVFHNIFVTFETVHGVLVELLLLKLEVFLLHFQFLSSLLNVLPFHLDLLFIDDEVLFELVKVLLKFELFHFKLVGEAVRSELLLRHRSDVHGRLARLISQRLFRR